jgi:hypothetical protein
MMNLLMAVLWLVVAAGVFARHWLHPEARNVFWIPDVYIGWFAAVCVGYNVVRWWSSRSYARHRQIAEQEWARRKPPGSRGRSQSAVTPDPNFNFTDEPQGMEPS